MRDLDVSRHFRQTVYDSRLALAGWLREQLDIANMFAAFLMGTRKVIAETKPTPPLATLCGHGNVGLRIEIAAFLDGGSHTINKPP